MNYATFVKFNIIGGVAWGVGLTLLGYYLGQIEFVAANLEAVLLGIVALSVLPILRELWLGSRKLVLAGVATGAVALLAAAEALL